MAKTNQPATLTDPGVNTSGLEERLAKVEKAIAILQKGGLLPPL